MSRYFSALTLLVVSCSSLSAAPNDSNIEADIVYGHKDGLALTMDRFPPTADSNGAAILFLVSGGWYSKWAPPETFVPLLKPFRDAGYTLFAVRHGSSPRYSIPDAVSDVRRSVRFVRKNRSRFHVDSDRLGVFGMSAGGHLSLMLGTTGRDGDTDSGDTDSGDEGANDEMANVSSRVAAVVALVPPTDLRVAVWDAPESLPSYRMFPALDLPMDKATENSPLLYVTADDAPTLVIMGGKDDLVPAVHGEWIDKAFQSHGVDHKLIIFPDAGHGLDGGGTRQQAFDEAVQWFDHCLADQVQN